MFLLFRLYVCVFVFVCVCWSVNILPSICYMSKALGQGQWLFSLSISKFMLTHIGLIRLIAIKKVLISQPIRHSPGASTTRKRKEICSGHHIHIYIYINSWWYGHTPFQQLYSLHRSSLLLLSILLLSFIIIIHCRLLFGTLHTHTHRNTQTHALIYATELNRCNCYISTNQSF